MKIAFIANLRLPSERANALQTAHMAAAFAEARANVTLYYPKRVLDADHNQDVYTYYDLPRTFETRALACLDLFPLMQRLPGRKYGEMLAFWLVNLTFVLSLWWVLARLPRETVIYSRDLYALLAARLAGRPYYFEAHQFPNRGAGQRLARWLLKRVRGVVVLTETGRQAWIGLGVAPERTMVAADGAQLERFDRERQLIARVKLSLDRFARIVLYCGSLLPWKGVDTLVAASREIIGMTIIVGGSPEQIAQYPPEAVLWVGYVAPGLVPRYLAAADVLVLPNSGREAISARDTSPLKLFEYMAARRAIVASDLPSLREVLTHEHNALIVPADDPQALAAAASRLLDDAELAKRLAEQAAQDVQQYSWAQRARRILTFIEERQA